MVKRVPRLNQVCHSKKGSKSHYYFPINIAPPPQATFLVNNNKVHFIAMSVIRTFSEKLLVKLNCFEILISENRNGFLTFAFVCKMKTRKMLRSQNERIK